jgi:chromosome segregation ATPase
MYSVEIKNNKEIYDFCMVNGITDINKFIQDCFKQGFDIKKYGLLGKTLNEGYEHLKNEVDSGKMGGVQEKWVEKEVIVEKRVEIPVEVIKEVEKIVEVIKEVPVEKIIEKEVYITDDVQINELLLQIQQMENEMSKSGLELDELRQKFSTKDDEIELLKKEFSTITTEKENIFQNEMSKKVEELDELRQTLDELKSKSDVLVTNTKVNMLQETLQNLRKELSLKNTKINELEGKIQQLETQNKNVEAIYLKGSNLKQNL